MPTCFVIQPFDGGKFDRRFEDTYKPALEQAGLEAYRVDRDPGVEVPIETIEKSIRDAVICFAEITTNNPNVWYELGYAFAQGRSTIMVCSAEREGKLPFDIHHRAVIKYNSESKRDFDNLGKQITERAKVLLEKNKVKQFTASERVAPRKGLSQVEIQALAAIAAATDVPGSPTSVHLLRTSMEQNLTDVGVGLALWRLQQKHFVELGQSEDYNGEMFDTVVLNESGWRWIGDNESLFVTHKGESEPDEEDDIPF